ncbi:hypothetical protein EJ110_NYTH04397 [Nymphaea thermarum]|nr:hypothetical protein EJ110_NYTH04397 [Nymphaea thermarum]
MAEERNPLPPPMPLGNDSMGTVVVLPTAADIQSAVASTELEYDLKLEKEYKDALEAYNEKNREKSQLITKLMENSHKRPIDNQSMEGHKRKTVPSKSNTVWERKQLSLPTLKAINKFVFYSIPKGGCRRRQCNLKSQVVHGQANSLALKACFCEKYYSWICGMPGTHVSLGLGLTGKLSGANGDGDDHGQEDDGSD